MGNNTNPQPKGKSYKTDDSNFFIKQMITKSQITSLQKQYKLLDQIGQGTYAKVYKAQSTRTKRIVAIKKVDKSKVKGIDAVLNNQFDILRQLDHPNLMKIYNLYQDYKFFYMVTQLIPGQQLYDHLKNKQVLTQKEAFTIFYQVLLAINHLHLNNIMHRDLKSQNVMFDAKSSLVKIIDFGGARQFENDQPAPGKLVGTMNYVAPQVINKVYNKKCDNWSLGIFLYLLLSGSTPFAGKDQTQQQIFKKIQFQPHSFDKPVWENISKQAKQLINGLLQKDPSKRFELSQVIQHPWVRKNHNNQVITPQDQQAILQIFANMKRFSTLKIAQIQLAVLVYMINFVVTVQDQQKMIRCFHWIDSEGDGVINQKELVKGMVEFQDKSKQKAQIDAKAVMDKIDFNKSGDINFSEFLVSAIDIRAVLTQQNLKKTFSSIDFDLNGTLSVSELKAHLGDHISESYYKRLIQYFDTDRDGQISLSEFKQMMHSLLK